MKILIVEDDQNKREQIASFLKQKIPTAFLVECKSYQSGLKEIIKKQSDLIVLDMSMLTFDSAPSETGGRLRVFAGREILRKMLIERIIIPVIIVTQFESFGEPGNSVSLSKLKQQLLEEYPDIYCGTIYYSAAQTDWKLEFDKLLQEFIK